MPNAKPGESQNDYIQRCMSDPEVMKERPNQKARLGLCYGLYRQSKKKKQQSKGNAEPSWDEEKDTKYWII